MNIHLKTISDQSDYSEEILNKIVALIDRYDCRRHVYFMTGNDNLLDLCRRLHPDIRRCCGAAWINGEPSPAWAIVERAIEYECCKVQLFKPYFNQAMIDKAHAHGIRCNIFYADDPAEAKQYLDMGIDCILTNDYLTISNAVKRW